MSLKNVGKVAMKDLQRVFFTDAEIAKQLGVTRQAIQKLRKNLGIPAHKEKRDKRIIRDKKRGLDVVELSGDHKLSVSQIYRILRKGGNE